MAFSSFNSQRHNRNKAQHSHFYNQVTMTAGSQIPTPLPSPGYNDYDLDLSTYSPLFETLTPPESNAALDSHINTIDQWAFCPNGVFLEANSRFSLHDSDVSNPGCFSPQRSDSSPTNSGFSSPKMFDVVEPEAKEFCSWGMDVARDTKSKSGEVVQRPPVKSRWTSCHHKSQPTEASPSRAKRIRSTDFEASRAVKESSQSRIQASRKQSKSQNTAQSKGRKDHNLVEKKYRSKLNEQFESLLTALPAELVAEVNEARIAAKQPEKAISKAEVLSLAKEHIERLEQERQVLERQRRELSQEVVRLRKSLEKLDDPLP